VIRTASILLRTGIVALLATPCLAAQSAPVSGGLLAKARQQFLPIPATPPALPNNPATPALSALTREMASDFGPLGVRVNAIAPGEIDTAILSPGTDRIVETIPLRRPGLPEEVARAIYYLCTDQSRYVTGAELHINGGQHV
jgi:hypothetical protein